MGLRRLMECKKIGCYKLTRNKTGYCDEHEPEYLKKVELKNKEWKIKNHYKAPSKNTKEEKFYSSKSWQDLRNYIKARDNYLCQECLKEGRITEATQVHHIVTILEDFNKRFDEENLVSLCNYHHKKAHGKLTKTEILKHEEETADIFQSPKGE